MDIQGIGQSYISGYQSMVNRSTENGSTSSTVDYSTLVDSEDANVDGVLSSDETSTSDKMSADTDSDSDGQLSLEEFEEMLSSAPPPPMGGMGRRAPDSAGIIEQEDTDGDGSISAEESALSEDMFSNIDADQDGLITAEEIEDSFAAQAESQSSLTGTLAGNAYMEAIQSFATYNAGNLNNYAMSTFGGAVA